jgi:GWxTD domain-containing protein
MNNKIIIVLLIIFSSCGISIFNQSKDDDMININYDYFLVGEDLIHFDIFYSIPYNEFIFSKEENGFSSNIISSVLIKDEKNNIVFNDSWSNNISFDYYDQTQRKNDNIFSFSTILSMSSKYTISIEVSDYLNNKYWNMNSSMITENFDLLSDLKLYVKVDKNLITIENYEKQYNDDIDTVWIKYQIFDKNIDKNGIIFNVEESSTDLVNKNLIIEIDSSQVSNYKINLLPVPLNQFASEKVIINCSYKDANKQKTLILLNNKLKEYNYSILLEPIEYVLSKQSYIEYSTLDSLGKIDYIFNYWSDNEQSGLLEEFYTRVEYANLRFKSIKSSGSQSDKGRIYILNGKPLNVDYDFTQKGDYEIWYYYDKKFIFINRFGYYECYKC